MRIRGDGEARRRGQEAERGRARAQRGGEEEREPPVLSRPDRRDANSHRPDRWARAARPSPRAPARPPARTDTGTVVHRPGWCCGAGSLAPGGAPSRDAITVHRGGELHTCPFLSMNDTLVPIDLLRS